MKTSSRDQVEGTFHKVKGEAREIAGKLSDNPILEEQGAEERIAGHVQDKIGQIRKVFGE